MAGATQQLSFVPIRRRSYWARLLQIPRLVRRHYQVARCYNMSKRNAVTLAARLGWQLVHP